MKTELRGRLDERGGLIAITSLVGDSYVIALAVHRNDVSLETLKLLKPGTRCRLMLETEAQDETSK